MKLKFNEKYLIILVVFCFITLGFYYSYAIFVTKQLQENVIMVHTIDNRLNISISDKDNKLLVNKKTSGDYKVVLSNQLDSEYYYLILVKGLTSGVKVSSKDDVEGYMLPLEKKELLIHVNNTTDSDIVLEFVAKIKEDDFFTKEIGYYYINKIDNFDHSGANKPELSNKLLPVSYHKTSDTEGYWYKADVTNQVDLWYSYENGLWANAILLSDNNYNKYKNKPVGTEIELGDILEFYVWIPRFKYLIINNSNYTNYERMSNVIFEKGNNTTGTVECQDQISTLDNKHVYSEVCKDNYYQHIYDNLSTYTHPSFKNKNGFWVNKFLMGEGEKSLPNTKILKKNINDANIISNKHASHMLTNMEYAAILLLSNSSYGKTGNSLYISEDNYTFTKVYANTYEFELTGCSSEYTNHTNNIITDSTKKCVEYNNLTNYSHFANGINYPIGYAGAGASSTGNITGVYDLVSINGEMVAAFIAKEDGTIDSPFTNYDLYSYSDYIGKVSNSSNIYNLYRYKLGDGIKEHFRNFGEHGMWHNGTIYQKQNTGIMIRGNDTSIYSVNIEDTNYIGSFRLVLD